MTQQNTTNKCFYLELKELIEKYEYNKRLGLNTTKTAEFIMATLVALERTNYQ